MNIIKNKQDKSGTVWAVVAMNNVFWIMFKEPGKSYFATNSETYNDPDTALKALERRVKICNAE